MSNEVITLTKILDTAQADKVLYLGKRRMWEVLFCGPEDGYYVSATPAPPESSHELVRETHAHYFPDLRTALDHVAGSDTLERAPTVN